MYKNIIKKSLFIFFAMASQVGLAASTVSCLPLTLKAINKNIILTGDDKSHTTHIYFMKNNSKQSLWLDHPTARHSVSAGWSSYIQPDKWSVLSVNNKEFELSCAVIQPGKVDYQDCVKAISVCVSPQVMFDSKRKGSYWLAEDKSWDDLLKELEKRGVKFKSSTVPAAQKIMKQANK